MSLVNLFQWLGQTPVSTFMQQSAWAFAVVEIVHLVALAGLGGAILLVDLRLLGFGFKNHPAARLAQGLSPVLWGSLGLIAVSGLLLLIAEPLKCYYNPAFRLKMLFLFAAVAFYFTLHRRVMDASAIVSKPAAVLSLVLWLGVGLSGRAIGFI
jgi:hypothetical protein